MKDKIRWGIIGPGRIAQKFTKDLSTIEEAEITAVASRSKARASEFAAQFSIEKIYDKYQDLFEDPTIDIVYIATPHSSHSELSIRALNAGKAVLSEKPSSLTKSALQEVISLSKEKNLFYMEGLWSRFNPLINEVYEKIKSGALGQINYLKADFGFYALDRDEESRILNPKLAGGSLLDIGIYPVFLAYLILGKPSQIKTIPKFYKTGAEVQISMLFDYPNAQAVLYSGFVCDTDCTAIIAGTKGQLHIDTRWHEPQNYRQISEGNSQEIAHEFIGNGFVYEINEVHTCLKNHQIESQLWSHQHSLDLMELLDAIRIDAGIEF